MKVELYESECNSYKSKNWFYYGLLRISSKLGEIIFSTGSVNICFLKMYLKL